VSSAAIVCPEQSVQEAWIDYNGHMNMAFYNLVFDQCLDFVFDQLGIGAATSEQLALHVDMASRKTAPFPDEICSRLGQLMESHRGLNVPDQVGHVIGIPR
jgi:acyl-CoA thioesterase FadM